MVAPLATIVFDADDTLWANCWQYDKAEVEFYNFLYKIFGDKTPNMHYLRDRYYQISGELFKSWGVRRGRVATAMLRLYNEVRDFVWWRFGVKLTKAEAERHEREIKELGDSPFDYTKLQWLNGAEETLQLLKEAGHTLCLLTSYDKQTFPARAEFMNISRFFQWENVRAIEFKKTKEDFIAVSGWTPESNLEKRWIAVGNGESDIRPALEISEQWRGIYIPWGSTSKFLEHGKEPNNWPEPCNHFMPPDYKHERVTTVLSLLEIIPLIER